MNYIDKYKKELLELDKEAFIAGKNKPKLKAIERKRKYIKSKIIGLTNPKKLYNKEFFSIRTKKFHLIEMNMGKDLARRFKLSSLVDFGCGLGSYLMGALEAGVKNVKGYEFGYESAKDYIPKDIFPYIQYGDVTVPLTCEKYDCVLSIEVAEHIHPDKSDQFVENLTNASNKWIVLTAAPPGQEGVGHINCQEKSFWIEKINKKGFEFCEIKTKYIKKYWEYTNAPTWLINNVMIFRKIQ
jgi:hypothetical protein